MCVNPTLTRPMNAHLGFAGGFHGQQITRHLPRKHLGKLCCSWATASFVLSHRGKHNTKPLASPPSSSPQDWLWSLNCAPNLPRCDVSTTGNNPGASSESRARRRPDQLELSRFPNSFWNYSECHTGKCFQISHSSSLPGSSRACYWASQYTGNQMFHTLP